MPRLRGLAAGRCSSQGRVRAALGQVPPERHATTQIVYTAHSIPNAMAAGCDYEKQLHEACRLVSEAFPDLSWRLVYQSRSGPPTQPWLEPDICDYLRDLHTAGEITDVVVAPIGFISDHLEVLFDLDTEAQTLCDEIGLNMVRSATVGNHPRFIQMIRELICERTDSAPKACLGQYGPNHDVCPEDCCLSGRPAAPSHGAARTG